MRSDARRERRIFSKLSGGGPPAPPSRLAVHRVPSEVVAPPNPKQDAPPLYGAGTSNTDVIDL